MDNLNKNSNNLMDTLKAKLSDQAPVILPKGLLTIEVTLEPSVLFADAGNVYNMEAQRIMRFAHNEDFLISAKEFEAYFKTLLYLRISRVNGVENATTKAYKYDLRNYMVPTFIHTLLTSIGTAVDRDYGFQFVPVLKMDVKELLSSTEMVELSRKLSFLAREGLTCTDTGVSMQPTGELSFMATMNISEEILSYKKDHPVYGFYASFFNHKITDEVMNPSVFRIKYGSAQEYATYVKYIV